MCSTTPVFAAYTLGLLNSGSHHSTKSAIPRRLLSILPATPVQIITQEDKIKTFRHAADTATGLDGRLHDKQCNHYCPHTGISE